MKPKICDSNKIEHDIVRNLSTMNHFWIMVLRKEANFLMLDCLVWCKLLVSFHQSAFEGLRIFDLSCSNHKCKVLTTLQLGLHVEGDGPHTPCSRAKKLKMWLKSSLTSAHLRTSSLYCKSTWSLSHSRFAWLLALTIAFFVHYAKTRPKSCLRHVHSWLCDPNALGLLLE
jgi:hypothetical protein